MSDAEDPKKVAQDVDEELTRVVKSLLPPQQPKGQRRFRFAIGLMCLAPFCITVAFFIWPSTMLLDRMMWLGYAVLLLLLGAWQLDKSSREMDTVVRERNECSNAGGAHSNLLVLRKKQ